MDAAHANDVTLCMAYYENPEILIRQYGALNLMPKAVRDHLSLIVVDDGSPTMPAEGCGVMLKRDVVEGKPDGQWKTFMPASKPRALGLAGFQLLRMDVDVRWNQDACRNLAVTQAKTKWVLLTDVDHLIPAETWAAVIARRLSWKTVYTFQRRTGPHLSHRNPHPNTWLMTADTFDAAGGYDERFAGYYGTDAEFRDRLAAHARIEILGALLTRVPRETVPDASTTTYLRKQPEDALGIPRIKAERALLANWKPLRLTFPYHLVSEC